MSGIVVNNIARASGTIAATPGGLDWSTAVVTASTATVEAGKGYFINTTSNACTVTLPSSADPGDQIVLADYARTWGTNAVTLDSNGLNLQGEADTYIVTYDTAGQSINLVFSDSTKGWLPVSDDAVAITDDVPVSQRALFAYGTTGGSSRLSMSNLVGTNGVVGSDVNGVGTARMNLAAASYGGDKALFAYGNIADGSQSSLKNLVNNNGVIAADVTGVGSARSGLSAAKYGVGLAIFVFGNTGSNTGISNLVNINGVVGSNVSAVGDAKRNQAGAGYGGDKAVFAYGDGASGATSIKNLVNNQGVVASDTSVTGTDAGTGSTQYGGDKAIIAFGRTASGGAGLTNGRILISNTGAVAGLVSGAGTAKSGGRATGYSYSA